MSGRKQKQLIKLLSLLLLSMAFLTIASRMQAQQLQMYTQFMYNKMQFNAGYAGSLDAPSAHVLYRNQWVGLEGAPEAQVLGIHSPLANKSIALGLNFERQTIGIQETLTLDGIYVYRLKVSKTGRLGLGVNISGRYLEQDFSDPRLVATEGIQLDNAISMGVQNKFVANIGFGAYYHDPKMYFGVSIPRLAKSDIDFDQIDLETSREARHFNIMGGYIIDLSRNISLTPQALIRLTEGAPLDVALNAMLCFYEKFYTGLTFRHYNGMRGLLESLDILAGVQVSPQLYLGFAYDITLTQLRNYSSGSLELAARYTFIQPEKKETYVNPRYF